MNPWHVIAVCCFSAAKEPAMIMAVEIVRCPICSEATKIAFRGLYDDRYGYPDRFDLHCCSSCGHMHIAAQFSPQQLEELYTRYYLWGVFVFVCFCVVFVFCGFGVWL